MCGRLGAECPKSLTKKCNLLIQGSYVLDHFKRRLKTPIEETNKSKEAAERQIKIVKHDEVNDFFLQETGLTLDQHLDKQRHHPPSAVINQLFSEDSNSPQIELMKLNIND